MQQKKRMVTAKRVIFLEFLKASIADLITPFLSLLQNSEGIGDGDSGERCADPTPPPFTISEGQTLTFSKKLAKTKIVVRVIVKKIKAKKFKNAFKSPAMKRQQVLPKFANNGESRQFLASAEALLICYVFGT
jgi:hypothetical protein